MATAVARVPVRTLFRLTVGPLIFCRFVPRILLIEMADLAPSGNAGT
jgi:hypothetical protein